MKQRKLLIIIGVVIGVITLASGIAYEAKANKLFILPELNSNSIDTYPPAKRDVLLRVEQQTEDARAHAKPKPKLAHPEIPPSDLPTAPPQPTPQSGIFNTNASVNGAFHANEFTSHNVWEGPLGSTWEEVYAGGTPDDPTHFETTPKLGAIIIHAVAKDGGVTEIGTFPAPKGYGPLTIISVNGTIMQLRSDSGQTLTFNLSTHQYK